ncbi:flagellar biosynthesis protein FlhB [Vampirovibrio sp.]|uniref:flagellar biosynthesis protein FlhB n=1 Tax=Vampirovibrio sp. TaxID=2717857 RepID=UPI0035948803
MSGEKTEKPTGKRVSDARNKGQVAKSQDFNGALVLIAVTWMMGSMGPYTINTVYAQMQYSFGKLLTSPMALKPFSKETFQGLFAGTLESMIWLMLPFLLSVCVMAIISNLTQVGPLFTMQALAPKLDKLNPLNGFKRLFSMRSVIEVVKAIIKMSIIGACGYSVIRGHLQELMGLGALEVPTAWGVIVGVAGEIAKWGCISFLIIGMADWRYQAWEMEKQLRMSKQDIKDERKNIDGDPMMKSRMRQMGMKMMRTRQLAAVPTADVVITNPTHYAIALKYDPDIAPAPVVVAMGKDIFAQKIKEVAKEAGVPMVENKPLARALYPVIEVECMVPPDLFVAVAEVLAFVFAKNKGRRMAAQKRSKEAAQKEAARKAAVQRKREDASE